MTFTNSDLAARRNKIAYRFYFLAVIGSFAVAFLTPKDILSYPWADFLVKLAAMLIPNVANERFVGELAGVAQFHSTLRWMLTPLAFVVLWKIHSMVSQEEARQRKKELYSKCGKWMLLFAVIAIPVFVIPFWFYPFDSDLTRSQRFRYGSRFGLGFTGAIVFIGIPFLMLGWYVIAKDFRRWFLDKRI